MPNNIVFGTSPIEEYIVPENHSTLKSVLGSVFSKDGTILYSVPKNGAIPNLEGVVQLDVSCMASNVNLGETFDIPSSVKTIKSNALQSDTLTKIIIRGNEVNIEGINNAWNAKPFTLDIYGRFTATSYASLSKQKDLIIRSEEMPTISNMSLVESKYLNNGTGYIYVPDNLVEDYKVAANWSTYANQIKPLSEYVES